MHNVIQSKNIISQFAKHMHAPVAFFNKVMGQNFICDYLLFGYTVPNSENYAMSCSTSAIGTVSTHTPQPRASSRENVNKVYLFRSVQSIRERSKAKFASTTFNRPSSCLNFPSQPLSHAYSFLLFYSFQAISSIVDLVAGTFVNRYAAQKIVHIIQWHYALNVLKRSNLTRNLHLLSLSCSKSSILPKT